MSGPRIGELFAGYGGLGMGVRAVLGGEIAWVSEFDAAPSKILEHHFPGVPNFGDITLIDWSAVPRVDVLTGGFPCQDVSLAGARKGLKDGTRSGLWSEFARAISALQPELVVIENVRGLLSADADSGMESCTECVGDGPDAVSLRALGAVLGDLAELGYDAQWCGVRAADAGAPHGRFRVFVIAYPNGGRSRWWPAESKPAECDDAPLGSGERAVAATDSDSGDCDGRECCEVGIPIGRATASGGGDVTSADAHHAGLEQYGRAVAVRPEHAATEYRDYDPLADAGRERLGEHPGESPAEEAGPGSGRVTDGAGGSRTDTDWGPYRPAVERWEHVTGRVAPSPTRPDGKNGNHRLSAEFVEFMMGLPAGHVTSSDIGLTRNEQLKALGNGVVPQQATLALRHLLGRLPA